jgi:flagellar hook-length control protein FliK
MMPFSGFTQTVTGSATGFGDKTANIGKTVHGRQENDDAVLFSDDAARSFLEWVQKAMNNTDTVVSQGEGRFDSQSEGLESDLPDLDQLQALIADAMTQSSECQAVSGALDAKNIDNGPAPLPRGIIAAIIAYHEGSRAAGNPFQETLIEGPAMRAASENAPEGAQNQPVGDEKAFQKASSEISTQAGRADVGPIIESPLDRVMKEETIEMGVGKGKTPFSLKPVLPDGDEGKTNTNGFVQERSPSGLGIPEKAKAIEPATAQSSNIAGQTRAPESMAAVFSDQQTASSSDDSSNSQGKDKHSLTQRIELSDVNEEELQKDRSPDSVKNTVPEQSKSHPSFQDAAKTLSGDQSTDLAVKPSTGQAAASVRPEASASKTFQTAVMDQIVDKAAIRSIHGRSEIQIRLKPEFLGNVQMNIAADKDQLVVRIMTDRPMVKEIIETHLHQLRAELLNQGLTIDKFEVMVNPDANQQHSRDQFAQMFKHHFSQNGRQQTHGKDPEGLNREGGNDSDDDRSNRDGVNYFA